MPKSGRTQPLTPELWHFEVVAVKLEQGFSLLRFVRRDAKQLYSDKHYIDLDISGRAEVALQRPGLVEKATTFVRALGLSVPVPMPIGWGSRIFKLEAFPPYSAWEKRLKETRQEYHEDDYRRDASKFMMNRLTIKTYPELWKRISELLLWVKATPDAEQRARRAAQAVWFMNMHLNKLIPLYGGDLVSPPRVVQNIEEIEYFAAQHHPAPKVNKKKMGKTSARSTTEHKAKQGEWL